MAGSHHHDDHAHDDHESHDAHDDHSHDAPDPDESTIRTPMWLPFVGLGLVTLIAIAVFGMMSSSTPGATGADADAGAPSTAQVAAH